MLTSLINTRSEVKVLGYEIKVFDSYKEPIQHGWDSTKRSSRIILPNYFDWAWRWSMDTKMEIDFSKSFPLFILKLVKNIS